MPLCLYNENTNQAAVSIPRNCAEAVRYAAGEWVRFYREATGAEPPLYEGEPGGGMPVRIGWGITEDRLRACGKEGYVIESGPHGLSIAGATPRGTLYGVYGFLEDYLGCRFYTPKITRVPKRSHVAIPEGIDRLCVPAFEYREPCFREVFDGDFAARLKTNGNMASLTEKHGGKMKYGIFCHSFYQLCPPSQYFDMHPEYYAEVDGVRLRENAQLCLTNPDVVRIVTENVLKFLRENPDTSIISVSQNDHENFCQCENCARVDAEEGAQSGTVIRFVNAVAEAVEEEFPDVAVDTFAYAYSRKAPKTVRPRPNVIVRLCNIERCFLHPVTERCPDWPVARPGEEDRTFQDELVRWGRLTDRIYVWDYYVNFIHYPMPHPILHVFKQNLRFYRANGVRGVFEQGSLCSDNSYFSELKAYLLSRLLWDPETDDEAVINEFLAGVYRSAAPVMRRIYDEFYRDIQKDRFHLYFTMHGESMYKNLTLGDLQKYEELFDRARLLADDDAVLYEVNKAHMWLRYLKIYKTPLGTPGRNDTIDRYIADCALYNMTQFEEVFTLEQSRRWMKQSTDPERHNYQDADRPMLYDFPGFEDEKQVL